MKRGEDLRRGCSRWSLTAALINVSFTGDDNTNDDRNVDCIIYWSSVFDYGFDDWSSCLHYQYIAG